MLPHTNTFRWAACCGSLATVLWLAASAAAEDTANAPQEQPLDFTGKIVVLVLDESIAMERKSGTEILANAHIRLLGDRYFIVGKAYAVPDDAPSWRTGTEVGVAWSRVKAFYAYTPELFDNYLKARGDADDE